MVNMLMVLEKWVDGVPDKGLSNSQHNIISSFKHSFPDINFNVVYHDECYVNHKVHIDDVISKIYNRYKPDVVNVSLIGKHPTNPTSKTFKFLKEKGCKTIVQWPDTGYSESGWGVQQIEQLDKSLVDLHVSWDNPTSEFHNSYKYPDNHIHLFVPQDNSLYFPSKHPDIPVSFVGAVNNQERQIYLNHAININQIPIVVSGGQVKLTPEQYASLIRRSRISINFSFNNGSFFQTKGRVYEVLASNSMLLESKNDATPKLLKKGIEYVEYENLDDFVEKIKYFLSHEEEAKTIANAGYKVYNEKYSAKMFWNAIFERIKI